MVASKRVAGDGGEESPGAGVVLHEKTKFLSNFEINLNSDRENVGSISGPKFFSRRHCVVRGKCPIFLREMTTHTASWIVGNYHQPIMKTET